MRPNTLSLNQRNALVPNHPYHVVVSWTRREKASSRELSDIRRVYINWRTPIEYDSDLSEIEAQLRSALQEEQMLNPDSKSNQLMENRVQIMSWQPLLGADRPGSDKA